ncbi:hypothetical protein OsI_12708 [Oryza sativa Indica Group]|uniref:Uncharacterized protein n=1 Tax=Oryza sativa subsp. indica TaxID=39946 RepID=A2XJT9_ORYSI|nr:hypothetical protein OsI_12708 [Oryza sativa Indica Group]
MVSITISLGFFAGLDGDELLEEERQLVLDKEHVAVDIRHHVQRAVGPNTGSLCMYPPPAITFAILIIFSRKHPSVNITCKNLSPRHSPARSTAATSSSTGLRGDGCSPDGGYPRMGFPNDPSPMLSSPPTLHSPFAPPAILEQRPRSASAEEVRHNHLPNAIEITLTPMFSNKVMQKSH